jgi:hypothetical protein
VSTHDLYTAPPAQPGWEVPMAGDASEVGQVIADGAAG